jgi:hypothetical protein
LLALRVLGGTLGGNDVLVPEDQERRVLLVVVVDVFEGTACGFGIEAG